MRRVLLVVTLFLASIAAFSQARLVIVGTSTVAIVESGGTSTTPIYIEIANPATSAITVSGSNGWIQSEAEFNMVKWDIGATTGNYVVPFGYGTSYYLPLTVDIGTAGSAGGSILFSTYHTDADNGNRDGAASATYTTAPDGVYPDVVPSDVTNMHSMYTTGYSPFLTDNSYNVVDRFWIIDTYNVAAYKYTTKPALTGNGITFSYIHAGTVPEFATPNIAADESDLLAQRFNPAAGVGWGDFVGPTTQSSAGNIGTVYTESISAANFYRSWTLSNSIDPLPVSLSSFTAQCDNGAALIQWTSQTEVDNAYYTVEKTTDNVHFQIVGTVAGAGTSSLPINYSIYDNSPYSGESYYELYQTDLAGNMTVVTPNPPQAPNPIAFAGCADNNPTTVVNAYNTTNNYIEVQINSVEATNFNISLINMLGQTILSGNHAVALGNNEIRLPNNVAPGVYLLNVRNEQINYTQKMVVGVR